jgi:calcium-dependent protein kinase
MGIDNCFYCKNSIISSGQLQLNNENNNNINSPSFVSNSNTGGQNSLKRKNLKNPSLKFDKSNFIRMKTKSLFDEYEIKEKLGEGAYGAVYKVQQRTTLFLRAVKAIKRKHVDSTSFSNEIAVLKTLDHPNIIKLFDCYYDNNYYYMVEEYCSGGDLFDYIQKQKSFSERKAAIIFKQLISAVNHLHKKKIVHRDLKPENIVFIKTNKKDDIFIKIIDFGTSVSIKHGHLTQELGTIYYIAPEVFKNKYNEKADIWACGIILYTMLCGHPPFMGNKEDTIKNKILNGKLCFPEKEFKNVSNDVIMYIKQLLEYDPDKRLSAEQALENQWLKTMSEKTDDEIVLSCDIITNLNKFKSIVTLQKATLAFLANQISINQEIQKLKDEFDKIDENKDGEISKDELIKCFEAMYPSGEAIKRANEIFAEIDFNHDGSISFSEFLTVNMKKEQLLNEDMLTKAFKLFDLDGNGYITINELKETMPLQITNNQQWIDLIEEVDKDGDCQISFDEFKDMMEKISSMK